MYVCACPFVLVGCMCACVHCTYVYRMHVCACMYSRGKTIWVNAVHRILPVNSRGYYKFQVEIGAATNQDFYIKIACKVLIYGFQPCTV